MTTGVYRYEFEQSVPPDEIEATIVLSLLAVEAVHGEAEAMLDAGHAYDAECRTVVIDGTTPVGRDFNRVFVRFASCEFGAGSFRVERVRQSPQPELVTA